MDDLPNGFTGFTHRKDGFESAGEASRRSRAAAAGMVPDTSASSFSGFGADALPTSTIPHHARMQESAVHRKAVPFTEVELESAAARDNRWAWTRIDLSAVRHNVAQVRRLLQPRCRLMAVVKADAYGHGAVEVSKAVIGAGADRLAVANVTEGVKLRRRGVTAPILVLSQPPREAIPLLLGYNLVPSVYEPDFAVGYAEVADLHGMTGPYHLAVNTGMNRIGVRYDEAAEFLRQVSFHRALELEGTFTHYATAECAETLDFQLQTRRFIDAIDSIREAGFDPGTVHAANSAAAFRYPSVQFDMVRLGMALYGLHPCPETRGIVQLRPAMSVHARITDARVLGVSEGVSFGLQYRSPGSVKVCTVPVGYADGLRRGLSNNVDFIVGGRYVRQVGAICMDSSMFEVDMRRSAARDRIDPQVGDEVVIVGSQGYAEVTVDELAGKLGTIPYEITTGFSRLPRVFV